MKKCSTCGVIKKLTEFSNRKGSADGFRQQCRCCVNIGKAAWKSKNRKRCNAYNTKWRKENPEKLSAIAERTHYKTKYGITVEQKAQMICDQSNSCAICGAQFTQTKHTCVDHDHKTGKVRGILCTSCNHGLGKFKDSVVFLQAAISYIEKFGEQS